MSGQRLRVLGLESSCDDTAVAVYDSDQGLLAHRIYRQLELHREWGGVVPELASRDHLRKILPLIQQVLVEADSDQANIDAVAYTRGPGLVGALMTAASVGSALAYAWGVPAIGVNHLEAHLMAVMLEERHPTFPFIALLVSGGHTLLVEVNALGEYRILGETLDDAAGEAFDKTARLLGLPYPGGPALARLAEQGSAGRFNFPRPMIQRDNLDFSFSGLKTHVLKVYQQQSSRDEKLKADIAYAFQEAVVETLTVKCARALAQTRCRALAVVGGVGANRALRAVLSSRLDADVFYPRPEFCTDNGAMVAYTGACYAERGLNHSELAIAVAPRLPLDSAISISADDKT